MSNIFQPQVQQLNSAVTPEAGVADTSGVELFAAVSDVAVNTGFSVAGKSGIKQLNKELKNIVGERTQELDGLKGNLLNIAQVMESDKGSVNLPAKARAALDKTKADFPWVKEEADALYNRVIGAGRSGSGGVFAPTAEEKAIAAREEAVAKKMVFTGKSRAWAEERVTMEAQQAERNRQFEFTSAQGKADGDLINTYFNQTLAVGTVKFMDLISDVRSKNDGSIPAPDANFIKDKIDKQAAEMMGEALKGLTDAEGAPITNPPNKAAIDALQEDVDAWVIRAKALVTDSATTKLINDMNLESSAREQQIIHRNFGPISVLNALGGQAYVQSYLDFASKEPGVLKEFLKSTSPEVVKLLGKNANISEMLNVGYNKLIDPNGEGVGVGAGVKVGSDVPPAIIRRVGLSDEEALTTSAVLLNPAAPGTLLHAVFDVAAKDIQAAANLKSMLEKNQDAIVMYTQDKFKDYLLKNEAQGLQVADTGLEALRSSFNARSFANTGNFQPAPFEIKTVTPSGKFGVPRITAVGEGLDVDTVSSINSTYRMLKANPVVLSHFLSTNGLPAETSAEDATRAVLLGPAVLIEKADASFVPEPTTSLADTIMDKAGRIDKQALKDFKEQLSPEDHLEIFGEEKGALAPPKEGDVLDGFTFLGGDPSVESNWKRN